MALHPASPWIFASSLLLGLGACGDDTVDSASAGATDTAKTSTGPSTGEPGSSSSTSNLPTSSASEGSVSDSATGSTGNTGPTTGAVSDTAGSSTTLTSSTAGSTSDTGSGTTEGVGSTGSGTGDSTTGGVGCEVKCGENSWSYVWIANSGENTVSKLDTRNMTEVGRYYTRPDKQGNPSRTSVSIDGKAMVVANRFGGLTKIWARPEYCTDKNGNGKIDTSSGKNNVLAFEDEECIAWHTPFPGATTQRPVAWTSGVYNVETCEYDDQQIWAAASFGQDTNNPCTNAKGITVYRVNGDTGMVDDTIDLPNLPCGLLGAYGAAVDNDNNAWFFVFGGGIIFRVDHETLAVEVVNKGFYGITVDSKSRVWLDDGSRYDPMTKTWAAQIGDLPPNGGSGVAVDLKGRVWHATDGGLGWLDSDTMVVGGKVNIPNNGFSRGIGVDVDGYIWSVPLGGTVAHRIHPETFEIATYTGLNSPYTYSDMAGGQINNVVCPQ
jgi:hypothetical protein